MGCEAQYHQNVATALVLSAGGMFAAWEAGAWKTLSRRFQPDMIAGTSAGAWVGWAIAGGATPEELASEWLDPRTARIMQPGLHRSGWLRSGELHRRARELFERYRPRVPFGLTVVELPLLRARLVREGEITWRHLAATCAIPLGFAPVEIAGRSYVDGGLLGALPLWAASEMGADRALALDALNTWHFRALRAVLRPRRPRRPLVVERIEPSMPLGSLRDAVRWSGGNIARWIEQGERDAARAGI
jgi:predicted acylesterase/phospholipase RssA